MSSEVETQTAPVEVEGLPLVVPPHLTENFERARRRIADQYGSSPEVVDLLRLWLACARSRQIKREFERALFDLNARSLDPDQEDYLDETGE